jgi:UDP-N-acetylglucosamine 2-epimerase (non-hydrolysing)
MIDSLVSCHKLLDCAPVKGVLEAANGKPYFLATIHRPSNVDDPAQLLQVLEILEAASRRAPVFFVTHPRTLQRLKQVKRADKLIELNEQGQNIRPEFIYLLPPLPYLEFLRLMSKSTAVLTDSGGIQEETTFLGIPCLTLRNNTERPSTVELGTNQIVGLDREAILSALCRISNERRLASIPPLWDGRAAERIAAVLAKAFGSS